MKKYIAIILSLFLFFFSSCKIGKEYTKMEIDMPAEFISYTQDSTCFADIKWWDVYADTNLINLIQYTLDNNKFQLYNHCERPFPCILILMQPCKLYLNISLSFHNHNNL